VGKEANGFGLRGQLTDITSEVLRRSSSVGQYVVWQETSSSGESWVRL
jgi:hypothetical protein